MRKLASIRRISELRAIPDADLIECAVVDGWEIVVKRGEFAVGDLAIYLEVDSWTPYSIAPWLSKGKEPRVYEGIPGERLRTVKLRGQLSQGLLLPVSSCSQLADIDIQEDLDVTELLGIIKWERSIPAQLRGLVKGNWPDGVPRTDEERCLSEDTLIFTENGNLSVKEIVNGRLSVNVYSFNHLSNKIELKPVINWSVMTRKNNWVRIVLKSGKEIICTANHKIWCADISAYKSASDIEIGQLFIKKS